MEFSLRMNTRILTGVCRAHYAAILTWRGEWAEAERELDTAVEHLTDRRPHWRSEAVVRLADLRRRQGRLAEVDELFGQAPDHLLAMVGLGPSTSTVGSRPRLARFSSETSAGSLMRVAWPAPGCSMCWYGP